MKEPERPYKSGNFIREPEYEAKTLLSKLYVHPDCIERYEERWLEDQEDETAEPPQVEEWWYNTDVFTLQDLLDAIGDANPKDVVISVHRDRQVEDLTVKVQNRTKPDLKAWRAAKAAEEADYQRRLEDYKKELVAYKKWQAEQKVKELNEKISSYEKGELDEEIY